MKRILVALDGSPLAPTVLSAAARMAQLADARLVLLRAISVPADMPREVLNLMDRSLEDVLVGNAHAELERFAAGLPAGIVERIVTPFATAWDGICRTARELDADLIVIGSHGYGGMDRVLGTTAAKVVNHADRNVLVVRTLL
ncbi:MAG TPA: universal stress protein [Kofleriaceae bacterium]|nr:universal stress protein [Kofleriaceae bacterium]